MFLSKILIQTLLLFVLAEQLTGCNYNDDKHRDAPTDLNAAAKTGPDFESVRAAIFAPKCVECHRQYSNYNSVVRELPTIQRAISSNRMPKNDVPLSESLRAKLNDWIAAGAPENAQISPGPTQPADPQELQPTWKSISENVLLPKCIVCHNSQGQAKFLDLSSRQIMFESRRRIFEGGAEFLNFEQPEMSYLIQILRDEVEPMPPPYSKIDRVESAQIDVIKEWIRQGLP